MNRLRLLAGFAALLVSIITVSAQPARARRVFPDTTSIIAILTDQLPGGLSVAQERFAATHYVGTQKLSPNLSRPLRAINPNFLVLHYRLAMWQSAPHVNYIVDGGTWGNDYPSVTRHETWFWHNPVGHRVASNQDGKLLMNVADPGFRAYWRESIERQVDTGEFDAVFLDSASPALLQWEARTPPDRRLLGTGVRFNRLPELGNRTWIQAWEEWIGDLDRYLGSRGIPLIPNVGALTTSWDNTDYAKTAGVFCEGFLDPGFDASDWRAAVDRTLALTQRGKIVILQNYLRSPDDVRRREYLLANYLLVKGSRTYLAYFARTTLEWYPEWNLEFGAPRTRPSSVDDLRWRGVYRRDYAKGMVLVNPSTRAVTVLLDRPMTRIVPEGGGPVGTDGVAHGRIGTMRVSRVEMPPKSAAVLQ